MWSSDDDRLSAEGTTERKWRATFPLRIWYRCLCTIDGCDDRIARRPTTKGRRIRGRASGDEDDDEEPFDLEKELGHLVESRLSNQLHIELAESSRSGPTACCLWCAGHKPLHTVMVGSKGMDFWA